MTPRIERVSGDADLDGIVEIARASFANPWSREMFAHELAHGVPDRTLLVVEEGVEREIVERVERGAVGGRGRHAHILRDGVAALTSATREP